MTLSSRKVEMLLGSYQRGVTVKASAALVEVSQATVGRYFKRFDREAGTPRPPPPRSKRKGREPAPPRYIGSPQIGKPIGAPPVRFGPDWIGKACPRGR